MTEPADNFPRQSALRLIAFSIAGLAIGGAQTAVVLYLPAFYAQRFGLSLGLVGSVFMLCRLLNAFSDPVIGVLSDRTQSRFGRRKPWVIGGGLLLLAAVVATYMPPSSANGLYLGFALFSLYLGNSALSTPLYAWAGSLSPHYHERTRNQTYVQTVISLGLVTMVVFPIFSGQSKVDAGTIASMGMANIAALVIGLPILAFWFKERPSPQLRRHLEFGAALRLLATDRVVLRVIGSDFFVSLGQGFRGALLVLFVTYYMQLPSITVLGTSFSPIFVFPLIQYGFGVIASPIWGWIGRRLGKNRTLIVAEVTQIVINLMLLLLQPGQYGALVALTLLQGLSQGSGNLMLRAIVSDVADQERLRTGKDHSGLLFSIFNVTINAAMALSVGIALPLVHQFGFSPGAANSPAALSSLQWVIAVGPAIGHGLSAILMLSFPLTQAKHAEIVKALAEQGAATPAPDDFTQAEESAAAAAART
ncbi:MAG TPA: MFS transporter [Alphaproteobacteria bacterium]|jgi:Na+/melibiose symporter-like transporter|nr:MFS transporter [Alphaproteobacteria bacterium]